MPISTLLSGTGIALITPFQSNQSVDYQALEVLIEHAINGGVEYIVALGTTAETPTLSKEEKRDIALFIGEKVNKRVPIVVGIGGNDTLAIAKELSTFPLDFATAVLSASPYYSKPSQQGLYLHYKTLAAASPKPILLYNVPGRTGRNLEASTTIRLANEVENIIGIKEATDDMNQCMAILRDKPTNFLVLSGDDALILPQIACGMKGIISVAANVFPEKFSEMVRLCLAGDFDTARDIHYRLLTGYELLFEENNPAGAKAFLFEKGLIENVLRLPVSTVSAHLQLKIKQYFNALPTEYR